MDVRLSVEQQAVRDSAAKLGAQHGAHTVASLDDPARRAAAEAAVAAAGWLELRTGDPSAALASTVDTALVAEELARAVVDVPFLGPTLAADLRRRSGAPPAADPLAETVLWDGALVGLARTGPDQRPAGVAVDAGRATTALLMVETPSGSVLGTVALGAPRASVDLTRPVRAPEDAARPVDGAHRLDDTELDAWAAMGSALACADLLGASGGALALARDYATVRHQYGRPIGSFQAVAHMLADAHVAVEGSRSIARWAAWAADALPAADARAASAAARAYCGRAAVAVCETAIQVHGGIGNTWDCLAHVFLRRSLLARQLFGGVDGDLQRVLAHRGVRA